MRERKGEDSLAGVLPTVQGGEKGKGTKKAEELEERTCVEKDLKEEKVHFLSKNFKNFKEIQVEIENDT